MARNIISEMKLMDFSRSWKVVISLKHSMRLFLKLLTYSMKPRVECMKHQMLDDRIKDEASLRVVI